MRKKLYSFKQPIQSKAKKGSAFLSEESHISGDEFTRLCQDSGCGDARSFTMWENLADLTEKEE
jgi:hypothetical protein